MRKDVFYFASRTRDGIKVSARWRNCSHKISYQALRKSTKGTAEIDRSKTSQELKCYYHLKAKW
jgi:hypothetical protein